jgi:zinc transporter ZupT
MVDIVAALAVGIVATFIPLIIGLVFPKGIVRVWKNPYVNVWLVAFSAGIIFWFFIDVMGDAAQLDINQGFDGDYTHIMLAATFAVGLGILFALEKRFSRTRTVPSTEENLQIKSVASDIAFAVAAVAALGIGFHAMGEGMAIGASLPTSNDVLSAIGGLSPGIAYVLHKFLEGFVIGTFAVVAGSTRLKHIGILTILAGLPTIVGFFIGLPGSFDSSYMFALGGAGAVYVEMKLLPVLARSGRFYIAILPLLLGFYSIYIAGLFHA